MNDKLEALHRQGLLLQGHPQLERTRRAWDRHLRRRAMATLLIQGVTGEDPALLRAAQLHAEASAEVERLQQMLYDASIKKTPIDHNNVNRLIRLATRRRSRRLHAFALLAKEGL